MSQVHGTITIIMKPLMLTFNSTALATLWLAMGAAHAGGLPAAPLPDVQSLAGQIVLDNSSEQELVISNTEVTANENEPQLRPTNIKQTGWGKGLVPFQAEVRAAAQATHIDAALIHAVIATESGYNPRAQSRKGAYGLMQVLPATAQTLTTVPVTQWSVPQQILWGSHYLKRMLDMFEGNVTLALAAYNAGPQAVKAHQHAVPPYAETRQYIPKVLGYYQAFKARLPQINE